jgi:hypothetical protein
VEDNEKGKIIITRKICRRMKENEEEINVG